MKYYPLFLDITGRTCLVVGGGNVGSRKAATLITCGARVTVISPDVSETLKHMAESGALTHKAEPYTPEDLDGVFLVFCATNDRDLNLKIAEDAKKRGILCNVADTPDASDFILPSLVDRGDLTLAVSTSGTSPAMAKKLRLELSEQFGDEYAECLALLGRVRKKLLARGHDPEEHKSRLGQLIEGNLLGMLKNRDRDGVNALLGSVLGPGFEES